jgi:nitrogen-specific signal transduction histidine kinase
MAKQLQESFTTLEQRVTQRTAELAQAKAETEQANQELEQRVSARTAELATLLEQLRESQLQMVQNEKRIKSGEVFPRIDQSPNQIRIHTLTQGDRTIIQIQDNGIGMSEQVNQQAFNYLFTTKAVGSGTGLRLAIANQIVTEKHHGTLEVESHLGQGTIFIITLPQNCDSRIADSRAIVG